MSDQSTCLLVGSFLGQPLFLHTCLENCWPFSFWLGQCLFPKILIDSLWPQVDIGVMIFHCALITFHYSNTIICVSSLLICPSVAWELCKTCAESSISPSLRLMGLCQPLGTMGPENNQRPMKKFET